MKKIFYIIGTIAAAAMTSCSNDATIDISSSNPDEISYQVTANTSSRSAADYTYSPTKNPGTFYVYASRATAKDAYITSDKITLNSAGTAYETDGGARYWPADALNFYAFSGAMAESGYGTTADADTEISAADFVPAATDAKTIMTIDNVFITDNSQHQRDLIYAVNNGTDGSGITKTTNSGNAALNFRHALSQLAFTIQNKNPKIYVDVDYVSIHNIPVNGKLTFGGTNTTGTKTTITYNEQNIDGNSEQYYDQSTTYSHSTDCTWAAATDAVVYGNPYISLSTPVASWAATADAATPTAINNTVNITDNNPYNNGLIFVIPNNFRTPKVWEPTVVTSDGTTNGELAADKSDKTASTDRDVILRDGKTAADIGAYFVLHLRIFNVPNATSFAEAKDAANFDINNYVPIYADTSTKATTNKYSSKTVIIPITSADNITWQPGIKYTYNFLLGEGTNVGYDPTTDPDIDSPFDPVLQGISYEVTADEIANGTTSNTDLKTTSTSIAAGSIAEGSEGGCD